MSDVIIVDTPDALLVTNKAHAQGVKSIVDILKYNQREELRNTPDPAQEAPKDFDHQIRQLSLAPGASTGLPAAASGFLVMLSGTGCLCAGFQKKSLSPGQTVALENHNKWRIENQGSNPMQALIVTPLPPVRKYSESAETLGRSYA